MSYLMGESVREERARVKVEVTVFGYCQVIVRFHDVIDQRFGGDICWT